MFRYQFPDLSYLKQRVQTQWQNGQGWPTVIMNAKAREAWRPDIKGTLTLFLNIKGESRCATGSNSTPARISEDHFFLTNRHEHYTLAIEAEKEVETFNIHFGEQLLEEVYEGLVLPADLLLADPYRAGNHAICFFSKLYPRDAVFNQLIAVLHRHSQQPQTGHLLLHEQLYNLLVYLLHTHRSLQKEVDKLPQIKSATRTELYKRLSHSLDYLHTHYCGTIELEQLAEAACLSKYHYLRVFKLAFGCSPYQMVQRLRVEKARKLLAKTLLPVSDISTQLGFENLSSFSRLFHQRTKVWPQQYRVKAA